MSHRSRLLNLVAINGQLVVFKNINLRVAPLARMQTAFFKEIVNLAERAVLGFGQSEDAPYPKNGICGDLEI